MSALRLVPCLDVRDGRVVKGVRFRDLADAGDPVKLAARYAAEGADELCLLDVSATPEGRGPHAATVARVRAVLDLPLTVGGGVRGVEQAERLFAAGADKIAVNSAAVERPACIDELAARFGSQSVVLALDAARSTRTPSGYELRVHSGRRATGIDALAFAREAQARGAGEVLATSVDRDGTSSGYELALLVALREWLDVPLIASGGARDARDLAEAHGAGADAVLVAGMLHSGAVRLSELKSELSRRGIRVRPFETPPLLPRIPVSPLPNRFPNEAPKP